LEVLQNKKDKAQVGGFGLAYARKPKRR